SFLGETWTMLGKGAYPGMVTATIGTALLVAVAWSSVVIVRRRLRYEWWYAVHLTADAAIALGWFHQIPTGNELVLQRVAADFSRRLAEIRPGTRVLAEGPFGVFTDTVRRSDKVVLIAGGIGITPVRALVEELDCEVTVVYRVLDEADLVFADELDELGAEVHAVVGDHASPGGDRLLSPDHLRELVPDIAERDVFLCGPPAMTRAIERNVRRVGVPRRRVHIERFAL